MKLEGSETVEVLVKDLEKLVSQRNQRDRLMEAANNMIAAWNEGNLHRIGKAKQELEDVLTETELNQ